MSKRSSRPFIKQQPDAIPPQRRRPSSSEALPHRRPAFYLETPEQGGSPMRSALGALALLAVFLSVAEVRAAGVDLEVILAADVSRSIDDGEFELQRKGYAAALPDPRVLTAIRGRSGAA